MWSYRHAFHAANHADVLKHAVFLYILRYFQRKPTPFWVMDTHAGAGVYDLSDAWASQSGEWKEGLGAMVDLPNPPALIADYLDYIQSLQEKAGQWRFYPGSPYVAVDHLRQKDHLRCFELHPAEIQAMQAFCAQLPKQQQRRVGLMAEDGFTGLMRLLPPPTRRGIVIMDPSYEDKKDYAHVWKAVQGGLKRFATGCFVIWYPQVRRLEKQTLLQHLTHLDVDWLHVQLNVKAPPSDGFGLFGSGLFVINPPYQLAEALKESMPVLTQALGQDKSASFSLQTHEKS